MVAIRYLVQDVETSIQFYRDHLGFELQQQYGPAMAILTHENLELWVAGPLSSAAQNLPDGGKPSPGGWNRFVLKLGDLKESVERMRSGGVQFRNQVSEGPGGWQVLCQDPSGNLIELFQSR